MKLGRSQSPLRPCGSTSSDVGEWEADISLPEADIGSAGGVIAKVQAALQIAPGVQIDGITPRYTRTGTGKMIRVKERVPGAASLSRSRIHAMQASMGMRSEGRVGMGGDELRAPEGMRHFEEHKVSRAPCRCGFLDHTRCTPWEKGGARGG